MSKAFLRESDDAAEPQVAAPLSPLPEGARNYLTAAGAQRLRDELRHLRLTERPTLVQRAVNDVTAKVELALIDRRIRYLQQSLSAAEIVTNPPGATDVVRFGTTVTVRDADGSTAEYQLVGVDEADPERGAVSWVSPLAQALMNASVGDHVQVATPAGRKELTVVGIRYDAH